MNGGKTLHQLWQWLKVLEHQDRLSRSRDHNRSERQSKVYSSYSFYNNLKLQIKKSMICSRTRSPKVHITMSIDILIFDGGLKVAGKKVAGVQYYIIRHYRELNHLLGRNWHFQGLNEWGEFYVKKSEPLTEYVPSPNGSDSISISKCTVDTGYFLHFCFTEE